MTLSYAEFAALPSSEKVTLVIAEAVEQVKIFTLHSGSVYVRDVGHFVKAVKQGNTSLIEAASSLLAAGEFYFDATQLKLYVRMIDSSDPKTKEVSLTYKFFFSNAPVILPFDLNDGPAVEFLPVVQSIGSLGQQLDDQNTGIVLESSSALTLENTDGYFDEIFDSLIWENQNILFYSWSPVIPISEAQKLFEGVIESKDFSVSNVSFKVKDFVYRLKNQVSLVAFSEDDGDIAPELIGSPKRRIYGKARQVKCTGLDNTLGGFPLTGLISISMDSKTIAGTGTEFLDQLSPGDELFIVLDNETVKIGIDSIESDVLAYIAQNSRKNINSKPATVKPKYPWRKKNRVWHIAGHKLRAPSAEIVSQIANNRYEADNTTDFYADDSVKINDEYVNIRRIVGNKFVFQNALNPQPSIGDLIEKNPVSNVYFKDKEMFIDRDWSLENTDEAVLTFDELAEFNIAEPMSIGLSLVFTSGSREITTGQTVDLRAILKPRDWIRKDHISETSWYEILDVKEQSIKLRTAFTGTTQTTTGLMKNVDLIDDDSLITVNCMGIEVDGEWIKTPSQAVRHLILNDAGFESVNEDSFDKAKASCDYILSMVIPESIGSEPPKIKDVITNINESVFGSLYGNSSWEISYSILNSTKPISMVTLRDEDIISFDVVSEQKIINSIKVNYRPFVDVFTGNDAFDTYTKESDFVNRLIGIQNNEEITLFLYEDDKAAIIAQRLLFFKSMSNCKVLVKSKMDLALTSVNDKIFIEFDRLYKRYGGRDRRKIGIVTSVKKNGADTEIEFTDLGNIFNRIPSIAPNDAIDYSSASRDEIAQWGFIVDNDTLTPDVSSELELGNNLIG